MAWTSIITFGAGNTLTAAQLNTYLKDNLNAAFPVDTTNWSNWTPTYANLTIGNGTVVARYFQVGKLVTARFDFTLGSTSAVGTTPSISTPVTAAANFPGAGVAQFQDTGTATAVGSVFLLSTTTFYPRAHNASGTYAAYVSLSATIPHTWAATDLLSFFIQYEAA